MKKQKIFPWALSKQERTRATTLFIYNHVTSTRLSTAPAFSPGYSSNVSFLISPKQDNPEKKDEPMATVNNENLIFYPAFCFKASPTHFTWVKMGAADVHRLRKSSDFVGMLFLFPSLPPILYAPWRSTPLAPHVHISGSSSVEARKESLA